MVETVLEAIVPITAALQCSGVFLGYLSNSSELKILHLELKETVAVAFSSYVYFRL